MLPSLFIAHGSPMIAIEESAYGTFLDELGRRFAPRAIVIFSAHWESRVQALSAVDTYDTIYDFGGFPEALYRERYPAPGDRVLAEEVEELLAAQDIPTRVDFGRGLDHGAWTLLKRLYPKADVPVVEMSVNAELTPEQQFNIGSALSSLRGRDILVIGSGVTVHNFQILSARNRPDIQAAVHAFERWLQEKVKKWDLDALFAYDREAPHAQLAVPDQGREHFVPLFYAMGAAHQPQTVSVLHESWMWNVMANSVYQFS